MNGERRRESGGGQSETGTLGDRQRGAVRNGEKQVEGQERTERRRDRGSEGEKREGAERKRRKKKAGDGDKQMNRRTDRKTGRK